MKRYCFILLFVIFSLVPCFSQFSFEETGIERPEVVDVRSLAMGGMYYCDFTTPYVMLSNPAGIPLVEKKTLLPSINLDLGGPLQALPSIYSAAKESEDIIQTVIDELLAQLSNTGGMYVDVDSSLPLTFAKVNEKSAFGLFNRVYIHSAIPSLAISDVILGGELQLAVGSAIPLIKTRNHRFSVGTTNKFLGRMEMLYTGDPSKITDIDFSTMPFSGTFAMGMDIGANYTFMNFLSFSAVWHDAYLGFKNQFGTPDDFGFSFKKGDLELLWTKGDLGLGVAIFIPTGFTKGILSSWKIYADYKNALSLFTELEDPFGESPWLSFSAGMEVVVFKTIALRVGLNGPYLALGAGIDLDPFHISFALYGQEKSLDPGIMPQMRGSFGISLYY